jgi:hypothetical protein
MGLQFAVTIDKLVVESDNNIRADKAMNLSPWPELETPYERNSAGLLSEGLESDGFAWRQCDGGNASQRRNR